MRTLIVLGCLFVSSCLPYPRQLGLITPAPIEYGGIPTERFTGSAQPLYKIRDPGGAIYNGIACFGPLRFDPMQGPMGSLVWMRSGQSSVELEAILRPALSSEDLQSLRTVLTVPTLLISCPVEVIRLSPLLQLPPSAETSFAYGKDGQGIDILVIRIRLDASDEQYIRKILAEAVGIVFEVSYRVWGSADVTNAVARLRSGSKS